MQSEYEKQLHNEIYGIRFLIFIENEPQSNKYRQLMLSKEQFKDISLYVSGRLDGKKMESGDMIQEKLKVSDELFPIPDIKETYSEEELKTT